MRCLVSKWEYAPGAKVRRFETWIITGSSWNHRRKWVHSVGSPGVRKENAIGFSRVLKYHPFLLIFFLLIFVLFSFWPRPLIARA